MQEVTQDQPEDTPLPDPSRAHLPAPVRRRALNALDAFRKGEITKGELEAVIQELKEVNRARRAEIKAMSDKLKVLKAAAKKK